LQPLVELRQARQGFFFKENVRYPVWTCRGPISLFSGDPMIIFSDSRDPNRVPKTP